MGSLSRSPRQWWDKGFEFLWSRWPAHSIDRVRLTWKVDPAAIADTVIRWPTHYQWEPRRIWGDQIWKALSRFVRVDHVDIPQVFDRVITAEALIGGRRIVFNVETSDYAPLNEDAYAACDLHFKMEYSLEGYGERDHLLPGGYLNNDAAVYSYLPRLRYIRDRLPPLHDVHGRYGLSMEKRRRPMEILRASTAFRFYGGEGKVRYSRYLTEVARSRVCIDLPSMSSIPFRVLDYLAIGTCAVGPPHTNQLLRPLKPGVHVAYCRPDYSDLEEVCLHYLEHDEERLELVRNSRAFFDAYVHRDQMASFYLTALLRVAAGRDSLNELRETTR